MKVTTTECSGTGSSFGAVTDITRNAGRNLNILLETTLVPLLCPRFQRLKLSRSSS